MAKKTTAIQVPLHQHLVLFKKIEHNNDALPVVGDDTAMKVLAAFGKIVHSWKRPTRKPPAFVGNGADLWRWISSGWDFSFYDLAEAAGVSLIETRQKARVLQSNRLVYPDGTLSKASMTALNVYVARVLRVRQKTEAKNAAAAIGDQGKPGPGGAPSDNNGPEKSN